VQNLVRLRSEYPYGGGVREPLNPVQYPYGGGVREPLTKQRRTGVGEQ